jgi:hypothetical protein
MAVPEQVKKHRRRLIDDAAQDSDEFINNDDPLWNHGPAMRPSTNSTKHKRKN